MNRLILYILFLVFSFTIGSKAIAQNSKIDSLLLLLKTDKEDTLKTRHLYLIAGECVIRNELDKGIKYAGLGLELANRIDDKKRIGSFCRVFGVIYEKRHNYSEAIKYYTKSIQEREKQKDKTKYKESYSNIANLFYEMGNYPAALKYYLDALKDDEEYKDTGSMAQAYDNIGSVYVRQKKYSEALKNFNIAINLYESIKDSAGLANAYFNLGLVLREPGNYAGAIQNMRYSMRISERIGDEVTLAYAYEGIGCIYGLQRKYKEALENFLQALKIKESIGDEYELPSVLADIGTVYIELKQVKEAKLYLNKSLLISKKINIKTDLYNAYEGLVRLDSLTEDYKAAFDHYKLCIAYRDSLNNIESEKKMIQVAMQYDFDKKEAATKFENDKVVDRLETDNKLHAQQRIFFIVCILVILVLLFFAKRAYDNKKKVATFMASENRRKEVLLEEVHHRINNNLQIISGLLSLQANSANDDRLKEYLKQSQNRIQSLSVLHNLLYQNDSPLKINMNHYLHKVLDYHKDVLKTMALNVQLTVNAPDVEFSTKLAVPIALIVNELVTNSIKYAFSENKAGQITISLSRWDNEPGIWILKIKDNGRGLPEETNFRKESLGLRLVDIMSKQIKGTFSKQNDNGAVFEIKFKPEA